MDIGIDIIDLKRIKITELFYIKVLHKNEIIYLNSLANNKRKIEFIAGRWAAKEAILKILDKNVAMSQLEIKNDDSGKPILMNFENAIKISISHEKKYCVAVALRKN